MRFIETGPDIPDELLYARDEGTVVFFCGAGVSKARAGLPDFLTLAKQVLEKLGSPPNSEPNKLLQTIEETRNSNNSESFNPVDRIFGYLEREFSHEDIQKAVTAKLQPNPHVDTSAHKYLVHLAKTPTGNLQLVTTNFDRLFDKAAGPNTQAYHPHHLHNRKVLDNLNGIVYLHGCAKKDYTGAENDRFVLSSSDFGSAYLSEGWATSFFKEIIERYMVVFIGYTADDPPVHYLLEGLSKSKKSKKMYTFVAEESQVVEWEQKGVSPIVYDRSGNHKSLWSTLEQWSKRAKSPEDWRQSIIKKAQRLPEKLTPYERRQVAHIVSHTTGAREFAQHKPIPPADWLYVFDPTLRYGEPSKLGDPYSNGPKLDPFIEYCIDNDEPPDRDRKKRSSFYEDKQHILNNAWSAFKVNRFDKQNIKDYNLKSIENYLITESTMLPERLHWLGVWISKVAMQPAAICWAADKKGLHPFIIEDIKREIVYSNNKVKSISIEAWEYLFEYWENLGIYKHQYKHDGVAYLDMYIKKHGWNNHTLRKYSSLLKPYISASSKFRVWPKPPKLATRLKVQDIIELRVRYAKDIEGLVIPKEYLVYAIQLIRHNIETAIQLETELGGYFLHIDVPIIPDNKPGGDESERTEGLPGLVIHFSELFDRLIELDQKLARQEFLSWPKSDEIIFCRLRIWAAGKYPIVSPNEFAELILELSDKSFWDEFHQRDLLLALQNRWPEISSEKKKTIEARLFKSKKIVVYNFGAKQKRQEVQAVRILDRVTWLLNNGCAFSEDINSKIEKLRKKASNWKSERAEHAADSHGRSTIIFGSNTSTDFSELVNLPLNKVLTKATELSHKASFRSHVEHDPFQGFCRDPKYKIRAFFALTNAAKRGEFPDHFWRTFLSTAHEMLNETGEPDKTENLKNPKLFCLIAYRIISYPDKNLVEIITPFINWLEKADLLFASAESKLLDAVYTKCLKVIKLKIRSDAESNPEREDSNHETDWFLRAYRSPAGMLANCLFKDKRVDKIKNNITKRWLAHASNLLALEGDAYREALTSFCHRLNWFYHYEKSWTEKNLLSVLKEGDVRSISAFWMGFMAKKGVPKAELLIALKPNLLSYAKGPRHKNRYEKQSPIAIIMIGWLRKYSTSEKGSVSDSELRDILIDSDDEFRVNLLWQIKRWIDNDEAEKKETWFKALPDLLNNVWPRQLSVKTPNTIVALLELAFRNVDLFPKIAGPILELVTKQNKELTSIHLDSESEVFEKYPEKTLGILHKVLPDNTSFWPYHTKEVLNEMCKKNKRLSNDPKMKDLQNKLKLN